jgi:hypothetical protein
MTLMPPPRREVERRRGQTGDADVEVAGHDRDRQGRRRVEPRDLWCEAFVAEIPALDGDEDRPRARQPKRSDAYRLRRLCLTGDGRTERRQRDQQEKQHPHQVRRR